MMSSCVAAIDVKLKTNIGSPFTVSEIYKIKRLNEAKQRWYMINTNTDCKLTMMLLLKWQTVEDWGAWNDMLGNGHKLIYNYRRENNRDKRGVFIEKRCQCSMKGFSKMHHLWCPCRHLLSKMDFRCDTSVYILLIFFLIYFEMLLLHTFIYNYNLTILHHTTMQPYLLVYLLIYWYTRKKVCIISGYFKCRVYVFVCLVIDIHM